MWRAEMPIAQWLNEICLISHVPTSGNSTGMRGRNSARIENSEWGEAGIPENRELGMGRSGNPRESRARNGEKRESPRIENSEWGEAGIPRESRTRNGEKRESREYIGVRKWSVIYERYFGDVVGFVDLAEVVDLLGVEGVVAYCRRLRRF